MKMSFPILLSDMNDKILDFKAKFPSHSSLYNGKLIYNYNRLKNLNQEDENDKAN